MDSQQLSKAGSGMIQQFLDWLGAIGKPGLYIVMLLEGSSLPFPGVILVLSFGYILSPGYWNTALLAVEMSMCYSLASLVPYFLAMKLEGYFPERFKKGLDKAKSFFKQYGIWSIALSRPFGIGNYISFVAGMSNVSVVKYAILTFVGIYPWAYVMIMLGDYFNGNYERFRSFFSSSSVYVYIGLVIAVIGIAFILYYKKVRN
ncbi:DedA family protein [Virgibacillus dakarensis]|uniref:DedA family protein n=1 Tax=Virgibacillus dakarensis TaxID=1917889 RepID=UPI000B44F026|nr:VTT domain-containing protein [Virgibacillus dakarensis]